MKRKHLGFNERLDLAFDNIVRANSTSHDPDGGKKEDIESLRVWMRNHPVVPNKSVSENLFVNHKLNVITSVCNKIIHICAETDFESWIEEWLTMVERFHPSYQPNVADVSLLPRIDATDTEEYQTFCASYTADLLFILLARFEINADIQERIECCCDPNRYNVDDTATVEFDPKVMFEQENFLMAEMSSQTRLWHRPQRQQGSLLSITARQLPVNNENVLV
jgi:hypothetical protein